MEAARWRGERGGQGTEEKVVHPTCVCRKLSTYLLFLEGLQFEVLLLSTYVVCPHSYKWGYVGVHNKLVTECRCVT